MRHTRLHPNKSASQKPLAIDEAKKLLDTSAEKNRNLLIVFMAYLATATILALSITDLDLLVDEKTIQLPLLSVGLPMWAFYTVVPFILLLLHFDVLQNVQEHNKKLDAWLAHTPVDAGNQLFPYILDFARVRYGLEPTPHITAKLVAAGTWLMYVHLPLLVLTVFFIRFADLQGIATGVYHLGLGGVDIYLLRKFWSPLRSKKLESIHSAKRLAKRYLRLQGFAVAWVFALWGMIQVLHLFPNSSTSASIRPFITFALRIEAVLENSIGAIAIVPRISAPNARPYQVKDDDIRLQKWLDPKKSEKELWEVSPRPLDWSNRRLAFANLEASTLRRIFLDNADLQGANLSYAQLQGANLPGAQLQDAELRSAKLQDANLRDAQLQGADLNRAQLQGADLNRAQLQGANLRDAQLQGAELRSAKLQDANLRDAQLQGAKLPNAQLQGANLSYAQLQGANLPGAQLQDAELRSAKLQDANLRDAQLQGADR